MQRGELYRVHKPTGDPKPYRVFVVVSRPAALNSRFSTAICAPVYSIGVGTRTQVAVGIDEGLKHESWIFCDDLTSLRKADLTHFVGSLSRAKLSELDQALRVALDLD